MEITNTFAREELVGQLPRLDDEDADIGKKFRIPVQERIENIDNDMSKRAAIIDRRLPALGAMRPGQLRSTIFTMRKWQRFSTFTAPKPTAARSSLDCGNGSVIEDNFCRFVGHEGRDYEMAWSEFIGERTRRQSRSCRLLSSEE